MDRERHLVLAERHVCEGEPHIARQREIVTARKHNGKDLLTALRYRAL
jgi:hypothetical protein